MISEREIRSRPIGAQTHSNGAHFRVWAPHAKSVNLILNHQAFEMNPEDRGYFSINVPGANGGDRYHYQLDHRILPDPASRFQPEGVSGPSEIVESDFSWTDSNWKGVHREELTIYELHVGTYTREESFEAIIPHLPRLKTLGINAIELMPVSQFSGRKNWGYDGVFPFSVHNTYGGPLGLKDLINACHNQGIGVILDVVYNHLGPEGNVLGEFAPYFQDRYHTPWGNALNFDGAYSDEVKRYFLQTLIQWFDEYHIDGLRLDAVHAILDESQHRFLEYLGEFKRSLEKTLGRALHLIAESDLNDPKILRSQEQGGDGLDSQWNDDLHHSIHALLTKDRQGYYQDYGKIEQIAQAYRHGTVYRDHYSEFRKCSHGKPFDSITRNRLVVYSQNHDQIGNRAYGERLITVTDERRQRLAAACIFLSPFTPLIFMGEEWAETQPFLYFIDHQDPKLIQAVIEGRRREFQHKLNETPPNPTLEETFQQSKVRHERLNTPTGLKSFEDYQILIRLSKWIRRERLFEPEHLSVLHSNEEKWVQLTSSKIPLIALFSFHDRTISWNLPQQTTFHTLYSTDWTQKMQHELTLPPFSAILLQGDQT